LVYFLESLKTQGNIMLIVVSPAKKLDFETQAPVETYTTPDFLETSNKLIKDLKKLNASDVSKLMNISAPLGELNFTRFQSFKTPFTLKNSKQAAFAFKGDTYIGLDIESFNKKQINYSQKHFRILSGLYGLLRPLDLIQPYRLEMGTKFGIDGSTNLYGVWKETLTERINTELKKEKILVNLASKEYFSAIDFNSLNGEIITPVFKEKKNGVFKIISFNAKRARGLMSQYIIKNEVKDVESIKRFDLDRYKFNKSLSTNNELVFTR
jgi:cytoplasmic iron level regulating protein YaaA (DUF328/UPF0246 family)